MFLKLRVPTIVVGLVFLALGLSACAGDDSPPGVELARHLYQGKTYALVEYADRLALFDGEGGPVTDASLARAVLHSYAWGLEIDSLAEHADTLRKVKLLDTTVAKTLPLSADLVAALEEIESLEANIPLVGKVSAQDALLDSYPGVADGIASIRAFDSDLNNLARNAAAVAATDDVIADATVTSELDDADLDSMFRSAIPAARELEADAESVRQGVRAVKGPVDQLASALTGASAAPIIGDSLSGYALTATLFAAGLQALAGEVDDFSGELNTLADQYEDAVGATEQRLAKDTARWLSEPHDDKWPP